MSAEKSIPASLLEKLRQSGKQPAWRCKLRLPRGRTIYGVEINADGEVIRVGRRAVFGASDLRFHPALAEDAELY
jgi:hypothetical protein